MPPSAGYDFVMHPHEHFELAFGFLDFEQRGQFEARQALVLGVAGECRCPLLALGSPVSAVEDGGFHFLDGGSDVRFPGQLVAHPPSTRAGPKLHRPSRPSCVTVLKVATDKLLRSGAQLKLRMAGSVLPRLLPARRGYRSRKRVRSRGSTTPATDSKSSLSSMSTPPANACSDARSRLSFSASFSLAGRCTWCATRSSCRRTSVISVLKTSGQTSANPWRS